MITHLWLRRTITLACAAFLALSSVLPAAAAPLPVGASSRPPRLAQKASQYLPITDNSGMLGAEVPKSWTDVEESEWAIDDEAVGVKLTATPSLDDFYSDWGVPGLVLSYSESLPEEMTVEELLDTIDYSEVCDTGDRDDLPDGDLIGMYQIWNNCDGTTTAAIAALTPADSPDYYVLMEIYAVDDQDLDAMEHIIDTLQVGNGAGNSQPPVTDSPLLDRIDTTDLTYTYVELRDPAIVTLAPAEYSDIEAAVWKNKDGDPLGYTLTAAPNIQKFRDTWTTPGIVIKSLLGLTDLLDADEILASDTLMEKCTYDDRYTDEHSAGDVTYAVDYDWYNNCGKTKSAYVAGIAQSDPPDQLILFDFLITTKADEEAFDTFLQSFSLDPELAAAADTAAAGDAKNTATDSESTGSESTGEEPLFSDITDDSGVISLRAPAAWTDTVSEDWVLNEAPVGTAFSAAPDLQGFNDRWDVPGIFIGVSDKVAKAFAPAEVLDVFDFKDQCSYDDRYDYESANLTGLYDVWADCGDVTGGTFVVLAATPNGKKSPLLLLYINMPSEQDTQVFGEIVNSLAIAGAVTSVNESAQEELLDKPLAVVKVDSLNIRSGPGTNYNRVGVAGQGDALAIAGQVDNCDWLKITAPDGVEGWASGKDQYVTLDTRCTDIPKAKRPAPPSAAAATQEGGARSSQPESQSGSSQAATSSGSSQQGCYLFQNQLGAELTVTFTRSDSGKGSTFKVAGNGEAEKCFDPGRYTYTIDAPPPWNSINGELTVQAGDQFLFPVSAE